MRLKAPHVAAIAIIPIIALGAAACGDDDDSGAAATTPPATTAPATTPATPTAPAGGALRSACRRIPMERWRSTPTISRPRPAP